MNAGIADGTNLSWMMATVLNGETDETILAAHERERHPITQQVSKFAMNEALEYQATAQRRKIPKQLEASSPMGWLLRKRLGMRLYEMNTSQFACEGLNFGYYYYDSPIIHYDDEAAPGYEMGRATESTVPGCRLPHFWLSDGVSIYDKLGPVYTLVYFTESPSVDDLVDAFTSVGLPLKIILSAVRPKSYSTNFVLTRPDQHIAWRGDEMPVDLVRFVAKCAGR